MTTTMKLSSKIALAVMVGIGGATLSNSASASEWSFSFGFGRPVVVEQCPPPVVVARPVPPPVRTVRTWVPERYETRNEQVLVAPEHKDRIYVEPQYEVRYDRHGHTTRVLVHEGFWREVCVPARYETRTAQVVIPGYWTEVAVNDRYDRYDRYDRNDRNDRYEDRRDGRYDPQDNRGNGHGYAFGHDKKLAVKVAARN